MKNNVLNLFFITITIVLFYGCAVSDDRLGDKISINVSTSNKRSEGTLIKQEDWIWKAPPEYNSKEWFIYKDNKVYIGMRKGVAKVDLDTKKIGWFVKKH